jgi:hypothetical protein
MFNDTFVCYHKKSHVETHSQTNESPIMSFISMDLIKNYCCYLVNQVYYYDLENLLFWSPILLN